MAAPKPAAENCSSVAEERATPAATGSSDRYLGSDTTYATGLGLGYGGGANLRPRASATAAAVAAVATVVAAVAVAAAACLSKKSVGEQCGEEAFARLDRVREGDGDELERKVGEEEAERLPRGVAGA